MFDINTVPKSEREHITRNLLKWGIAIDQQTGKIEYIPGFTLPEVKCDSLHLIRHAETVAVAKHEFMSDTSENWHFTPEGIEITRAQAKQLDSYGFDIALYGPIPRVAHTMELIMQTPQKFDAIKVHKLHGIDNTGWEYKSFEQLQHDPTFVAREVENNMFARTPQRHLLGHGDRQLCGCNRPDQRVLRREKDPADQPGERAAGNADPSARQKTPLG